MLSDLRTHGSAAESVPIQHRFRRQKTQSQHYSLLTGAGRGEEGELSGNESNDYLVEVGQIEEIDATIRREIERKYRKSKVNAEYVFPRTEGVEGRKTPSPLRLHPMQAIVKRNEGHKASKSFLEEVLRSVSNRPSTAARKLCPPPRHISQHVENPLVPISIRRGKNPILAIRVQQRKHQRAPSELAMASRSKSPYSGEVTRASSRYAIDRLRGAKTPSLQGPLLRADRSMSRSRRSPSPYRSSEFLLQSHRGQITTMD